LVLVELRLYQFENKTPDINRFYFLFSALKKYSIAKAMKDFFALKQENIFQFIYQQFCFQIGINIYKTFNQKKYLNSIFLSSMTIV